MRLEPKALTLNFLLIRAGKSCDQLMVRRMNDTIIIKINHAVKSEIKLRKIVRSLFTLEAYLFVTQQTFAASHTFGTTLVKVSFWCSPTSNIQHHYNRFLGLKLLVSDHYLTQLKSYTLYFAKSILIFFPFNLRQIVLI